MANIYVPGRGYVDTLVQGRVNKLSRAAYEYDERLTFRLDEPSQQWAVFIKMPRGSDPPELPILGFGYELPSEDKLIEDLNKTDGMKFGQQLLDDMNRRNAEKRKETERLHAEAVGESADRVEKLMRNHGKSPIIKSTAIDPKQRRTR